MEKNTYGYNTGNECSYKWCVILTNVSELKQSCICEQNTHIEFNMISLMRMKHIFVLYIELESDTWYHHPPWTVSWVNIWEFQRSQRDVVDDMIIAKMIIFDIICYVYWDSASKFKLGDNGGTELTFPQEILGRFHASKGRLHVSGKLAGNWTIINIMQ